MCYDVIIYSIDHDMSVSLWLTTGIIYAYMLQDLEPFGVVVIIIIIIIIHRIYIALYIKIDLKALNDIKHTRKNTDYYST